MDPIQSLHPIATDSASSCHSDQSNRTVPDVPTDPLPENEWRLWIGNLDSRITEYTLLKLVQKYGTLDKFDFLYHKVGPDAGKPRGYCFVTYSNKQEAERALKALDGKLALSKRLAVRWAHKEQDPKEKQDVLSTASAPKDDMSADAKIQAIEMKLKMMEKTSQEFTLSSKPSAIPGTSKYSCVNTSQIPANKHVNKPYHKRDNRR